jgi:hypothetical protein
MSGAIPPLPLYAFMAWRLVKAQGQLYLFTFLHRKEWTFRINLIGQDINPEPEQNTSKD